MIAPPYSRLATALKERDRGEGLLEPLVQDFRKRDRENELGVQGRVLEDVLRVERDH